MKRIAMVACLGASVCGSAVAQGVMARERVHVRAASQEVVTGNVCLPDGSPAAGAVVRSSAGGECRTGADGSFTLAIVLPSEAESVELTASLERGPGAALGAMLGAVVSFVPSALTPKHSVGRLVVAPAPKAASRWQPTFGRRFDLDLEAEALVTFDDGTGPALYAGGVFTLAGNTSASCIARWDGSEWSALGAGCDGRVLDLAVFDDGHGAALYAVGTFTSVDGLPAPGIARWSGSSWTALGSGITGGSITSVDVLEVFDDGSGPALYAAGRFTTAGGVPAANIARWNGTSWSALGSGTFGTIWALEVHDDGSGPALYAGGSFSTAGGVPAFHMARWNGSSWSGGLDLASYVYDLQSWDDGSGPALYAGSNGQGHPDLARWNGTSWSAVGGDTSGTVNTLAVFDDGSGPALYAGGRFTRAGNVVTTGIARWNGTSWSSLGSGIDGSLVSVNALAACTIDGESRLYAAGRFEEAGGARTRNIASWNGAGWPTLGRGLDDPVHALVTTEAGAPLLVGGEFESAEGQWLQKVGSWNATGWSALEGFLFGGRVRALAWFEDQLYAGGSISNGDIYEPENSLARYTGSSWSFIGGDPNGGGLNGEVRALVVHDDGSGSALYAGGAFARAPGIVANHVARWRNSAWTTLGSGMDSTVNALVVFDDGNGPALYAGGDFTLAGGVPANHIAKWDGTSWSPLAGGMNGPVNALAVFDDGSGPALYGGSSGGPHHIARWNGTSWSALNGGMNAPVLALAVFDDGNGAALYAGGSFTVAGGVASNHIARWNGARWRPLGSGLPADVLALTAHDDGRGTALYVGGQFLTSPAGDSYLAKWGAQRGLLRR